MDAKIKKVLKTEKKAVKGTKALLKADKKMDAKLAKCSKKDMKKPMKGKK